MPRDHKVVAACPKCKGERSVMVAEEDLKAFIAGKHVQMAFPYLNADDRELFLSGICPKCWDVMFKEPEEDC